MKRRGAKIIAHVLLMLVGLVLAHVLFNVCVYTPENQSLVSFALTFVGAMFGFAAANRMTG